MRVFVSLFFFCVAMAQRPELNEFKEVYTWNKVEFKWPDSSTKLRALSDARYQPINCALSAIRAWRDKLYVTLPRLLPGVPATLASLPAMQPGDFSPMLDPFPSWDMQAQGNCTALQFVRGIEIDARGKMWVPDSGLVNRLSGKSDSRCPAKLVIIDVDSARVERTVQFEPNLLGPDSMLGDIVVGDDDVAYVSDASVADPGIVVVSARDSRAWKVRDRSMRADSAFVQIGQRRTELRDNVFALALSPRPRDGSPRRLYYSPLSSYEMFSLPVDALATPGTSLSALVKNHGRMQSPIQAATSDWHGNLYMGYLEKNAVALWDSARPLSEAKLLTQDPERLQYVSSLGIDADRNLWVVSNRMQNFVAGTVNLDTPNYRVIRAFVDAKSYLYNDDMWVSQQASSTSMSGFGTTSTLPPMGHNATKVGNHASNTVVFFHSLILLSLALAFA